MQEKLKEYGFAASVTSKFIADIFGKRAGNTFYAGLIDSASLSEFDERFEYLKSVWDLRESTCMQTSEPRFYNYFTQREEVVRALSGGTVNTGAIMNLTTPPQPVSVSVVTTQSTVAASLGPQCAYAIPVTCTAVNISTPQTNNFESDVHPPPVSSGPPPLIHTPQATVSPFYLKPLSGNIRVCQGCRGSLWLSNGSVLAPPFDIVVARMEKRSFRDTDGTLRTPMCPSLAHYHACLTCIRALQPNFVASTQRGLADVSQLLTPQHHQHLNLEFGL